MRGKGELVIAGRTFTSRLFVGTGKFSGIQAMCSAIEASGTEMVTVALRRVDITNPHDDVVAAIDRKRIQLLPNTSGARDAREAVRIARLAREASGVEWLKLEVTPALSLSLALSLAMALELVVGMVTLAIRPFLILRL